MIGAHRSGWRAGFMGLVLGALAASSASGHFQDLSAEAFDRTATHAAEHPGRALALQRRARLPDGALLVLAADGRSVSRTASVSTERPRTWPLDAARRNASVTLLPSGRVLIWGGAGESGELHADGLIFDPELNALEPVALPLAGRTGHTATVLTDGRILLAGGQSNASGYAIWHEDTGETLELPEDVPAPRGGHRADLLADGRVRFVDGNRPGNVLVFDPTDDRVHRIDLRELHDVDEPGLAASLPVHGADDVPTTQRLALRFGQRIAARSLGVSNVVLLGPGGGTPVETVVVEDGRLAFVSPRQELFPDTPYTLLIDGLETVAGKPVERIAIDFRTAGSVEGASGADGVSVAPVAVAEAPQPAPAYCGGESTEALPCREQATLTEGAWTPGRANTDGRWRLPGRQADLMPTQLMARVTEAVGLTSLTGQILRVDGEPVEGVEISVGALKTRTDAQGRFWLYQVPAGRQEFYVDGTAANRPGVEYGQFVVGADVEAGTLNQLPYTMYLPRISERDKVSIDSPLQRDVVLTHPDMPGLQVHVPAGTVVRDRKGRLVRELAIVPTPVNRAPFPVAENYPMYFTIEPGGAVVQGLNPESARGIRVFYPNYDQHPAGTQADFWIYDPAEGWRVYGKGRVTSDESRFAPEAGVALHQTMGGSYSVNTNDPAPEDDLPPDCQSCGEGNAGTGQNATAGDPIDLRTGQFSYQETDIAIADVVPISLARSYSPRDLKRRDFGIGTASNFGYRLHAVSGTSNNVMQLVLPNGAKLLFQRASGTGLQGSWRHYGTSSLSGSLLQQVSDGGYKYRLTLRDGSMMQFAGYSPNRLLWTQDRYGNRTEYVHDAGLVSRIVSPSGRYIVLEYDSNSRISRAIDQQGATWQYAYNSAGLLSKVTYPDGTERNYHYEQYNWASAVHRIREIHDRRGHVLLKNEWVAGINDQNHGRVTKQTLADGSVYHIDYHHMVGEERGVLVTHPDGSQRRVVFDEEGGLYPISDTLAYGTPLAQTFEFERDGVGRMTARIDPLGRRTEYAYDAMGQVTRVTSLAGTPQAITATVAYNADAQPTQVTDALGRSTTLTYDNGCLTRITNPLGYSTTLTCNAAGQPDSVVDALSNVTSLGYLGPDLTSVTDPLGRSVQFRHDALGRVIATEDAQGNLTRHEYDAEGRVVKTIDAAGQQTEIGYDPNGNVTAVLMPNGSGITYEYDSRDRLVERTDNLGQSESWTWDTMNRVASYTDRKGQTTTYAYDALGRPTTTTYADGSTVTATYDAGDRLLSLTDSVSGTLGWVYDDLDRVIEAISPQGSIAYEYDAAGRRTAMTAASQPRVEYQYDANDRLTRILQGAETVEFAYDALDRLTQQTLPNGIETGYAYNDASQLGGIAWRKPDGTPLHSLGYGYDRAGRRVAQTGSLAPQALPPASTGANAFDDNNRQLQYNGTALTYDANGNLTSDGTRSYVWDARDQLVEIKQGANTIASYGYDVLGRRYTKTEGGTTTAYLHDGTDPIQETQGTNVVPILAGLNIDERYARGSGAHRHYFLTDALGSTRALADSNGSIIQSYDYDPYGGTHPANATIQNPYRYTGREQDASGLYYYRARYYHPGMGRFASEDPLGLAAGDLNVYAYVFGDPASLTDPTGEFAWGVAFAAADLALQLYQNGGNIACVNWGQVGLSMLGGGLLNGLLKGAFKFKTVGSHTWDATRKWMNRRGIQRLSEGQQRHHWLLQQNQGWFRSAPNWLKNQPWNTNPVSSKLNNWLGSRPHLAPLGAPSWAPEVVVGGAASILAPDRSGNCGC